MVPIKINSKSYKIKSISELNTAEFIELSQIEALDFVKYVSWQTGQSMNDAFFAVTSKAVELAIGTVPDISKIPAPKLKYIDLKKTIATLGQRHQVEGCNLTCYDLLVFCLAVAQAHSVNIDDVYLLRDVYMKKPWKEILPSGFFFYKIYSRGNKKEPNCFQRLLNSIRKNN